MNLRALAFGTSLLALVASACGEDASGTANADATRQLLDHSAWADLDESLDPLAGHRPAEVDCGPGAWISSGSDTSRVLDIDTGACNYISIWQPSQAAVHAGDELNLVLWHLDLYNPEPATVHAAILLDDEILWETTKDIPGEEEAFDINWTASADVPAASRIVFHLHNHGTNEWKLLRLQASAP